MKQRFNYYILCLSFIVLAVPGIGAENSPHNAHVPSYMNNFFPPPMPEGYPEIPGYLRDEFSRRWSSRAGMGPAAVHKIAFVVDNPLYVVIESELLQYINDVERLFPVEILLFKDESWRMQRHSQVRSFLQTIYADHDINGAVLIGFFPYMVWELDDDTRYPVLLNYEDLDGIFRDTDSDGFYDKHTWVGNGIEIWVSWMRPYQPSETSVDYTGDVINQIQSYLAKCHRYYNRELVFPKRALIYVNEPWWPYPDPVRESAELIYGSDNVHIVSGEFVFGDGHEYLNLRASGSEIQNIWCHSSGYGHYFDQGAQQVVWAQDLDTKNGTSGIINILWACHGADFGTHSGYGEPTGSLAAKYACEANGLVSIGVTRSGYTYGMELIIDGLGYGGYIGEVFLDCLNTSYRSEQDFLYGTYKEVWGQILVGNPFVYASSTTDMSAPGSSISGRVLWNDRLPVENARISVRKDDQIRCVTYTDAAGMYTADYLPEGIFTVEAATPSFQTITSKPVTITTGEEITGITLIIPRCSSYGSTWYYIPNIHEKSMLPADWNLPVFDSARWLTGETPFVPHGEGTNIMFTPQIYLRKSFRVDSADQSVFLNVSADNGPEVYVNGTQLTMPHWFGDWFAIRDGLDYWNYRIDITPFVTVGDNYIVVAGYDYWCGNFIDASLYTTTTETTLPLSTPETLLLLLTAFSLQFCILPLIKLQ